MATSKLHKEAADAAFRGDAATLQECFNRGLSPFDKGVLLNALQNGDLETIQVILNSGGDINQDMEATGTPLISALRHNHRRLLEFIFSLDVDPNLGTWGHWLPPLSVAVRYTTDIKWIKVLLEKGTKIKGTGALHVASILGNLGRMRLLLDHGADVNEVPFMPVIAFVGYHGGGTPLHWAIAGGHSRAVNLLLDHHPDLSIPDKDDIPGRDFLARFKKDHAIEEAKVPHTSANHDSPESEFPSRLLSSTFEATRADTAKTLYRLPAELLLFVAHFLEEGVINSLAQANSRLYALLNPYLYRRNALNSQSSALLWAAKRGREVTVQNCVLHGANLGVVDNLGRSPLFCAASKGHEKVVKFLLETGKVDADSGGSCGSTPLSTAASNGREEVVKLLLANGKVGINSKDTMGTTPLWWAASEGHEEVVRLLLGTGQVDIDSVKDYEDCAPLLKAASNGHTAVVKLLLETGRVDIDATDFYNRTALWRAASEGHEAVVKLLLGTGKLNVNSTDCLGCTPLSEAASKGHEMVVRLLLEAGGRGCSLGQPTQRMYLSAEV